MKKQRRPFPPAEYPRQEKQPEHAGDQRVRETHPAFGQISASRVSSGGGAWLYGSDFKHRHYMTVSITRSEMDRHLSTDWPFPKDEIVRVAMSEQQWATFVSTPNTGSGACCTLERIEGEPVAEIAGINDRRDQFQQELRKTQERPLQAMKDLHQAIDKLTALSGSKRKELHDLVDLAERNLEPNLRFVADQFGAHMEHIIEASKTEIAAHMEATLVAAGLKALGAQPPLVLEDDDDQEHELRECQTENCSLRGVPTTVGVCNACATNTKVRRA